MTKKAESILQEALTLDDAERADIAGRLLESIEPPPDADVRRAWREEVRRRVAQIDAGEARLVPWDEVREELFARLNERP
jgi:putative addiction module component (TIGR02574 family)